MLPTKSAYTIETPVLQCFSYIVSLYQTSCPITGDNAESYTTIVDSMYLMFRMDRIMTFKQVYLVYTNLLTLKLIGISLSIKEDLCRF